MKLNSRWFDRIRIAPRAAEEAAAAEVAPCQHPGCGQPGGYRAPKGRGKEGQYWNFCVDHVRAYNQKYNYFAGMGDEAVASLLKDAMTGHRPTWAMGVNGAARGHGRGAREARPFGAAFGFGDPFNLFGDGTPDGGGEAARPQRQLQKIELKSLEQLNLDASATAGEIKARFKELVKRLHPDANGGDRGSEDKLREIIQAYNHLRQAGLC